jgi:hypothetical protein
MATPVRVSLKIRIKIRVPTAAKIKPHRRPDGTMAKPSPDPMVREGIFREKSDNPVTR